MKENSSIKKHFKGFNNFISKTIEKTEEFYKKTNLMSPRLPIVFKNKEKDIDNATLAIIRISKGLVFEKFLKKYNFLNVKTSIMILNNGYNSDDNINKENLILENHDNNEENLKNLRLSLTNTIINTSTNFLKNKNTEKFYKFNIFQVHCFTNNNDIKDLNFNDLESNSKSNNNINNNILIKKYIKGKTVKDTCLNDNKSNEHNENHENSQNIEGNHLKESFTNSFSRNDLIKDNYKDNNENVDMNISVDIPIKISKVNNNDIDSKDILKEVKKNINISKNFKTVQSISLNNESKIDYDTEKNKIVDQKLVDIIGTINFNSQNSQTSKLQNKTINNINDKVKIENDHFVKIRKLSNVNFQNDEKIKENNRNNNKLNSSMISNDNLSNISKISQNYYANFTPDRKITNISVDLKKNKLNISNLSKLSKKENIKSEIEGNNHIEVSEKKVYVKTSIKKQLTKKDVIIPFLESSQLNINKSSKYLRLNKSKDVSLQMQNDKDLINNDKEINKENIKEINSKNDKSINKDLDKSNYMDILSNNSYILNDSKKMKLNIEKRRNNNQNTNQIQNENKSNINKNLSNTKENLNKSVNVIRSNSNDIKKDKNEVFIRKHRLLLNKVDEKTLKREKILSKSQVNIKMHINQMIKEEVYEKKFLDELGIVDENIGKKIYNPILGNLRIKNENLNTLNNLSKLPANTRFVDLINVFTSYDKLLQIEEKRRKNLIIDNENQYYLDNTEANRYNENLYTKKDSDNNKNLENNNDVNIGKENFEDKKSKSTSRYGKDTSNVSSSLII